MISIFIHFSKHKQVYGVVCNPEIVFVQCTFHRLEGSSSEISIYEVMQNLGAGEE
jgi:hypothetical protein